MLAKLEQNRIYQNSVSPGLRKNLFATYQEYISLVNILDGMVKEFHVGSLAMLGSKHLSAEEKNPWCIDLPDYQDKEDYNKFLELKRVDTQHTCYVSTNHTSPRYKDEPLGIISAPDEYQLFIGSHPLPQKVERYVLAYPKDETLKGTRFIIDGKYIFEYEGKYQDKKIEDAFNDELFERKFSAILESFAQFPENLRDLSEQERKQTEIDVYASIEVLPIENAILDALSLMAEESNKILKEIVGKRVGVNYLAQAEKENLLPSASALQDYLNVRHLLHHQWDTLDGIGKFNDDEVIKNASVRRRYLDSYAKLCDMRLKDRIEAYSKAADDFRPLVAILQPELITRRQDESNNKFINYIKDLTQKNPDRQLFIETGYAPGDKKKTFIKNLLRVNPNIVVIDKSDTTNLSKIDDLMNNYKRRRIFIDIFQQLENRICQHCLLRGKNYTAPIAWDYLRNIKIISPAEAKMWSEYKKLRNDLSHKYMDEELNKRVIETLPKLSEDAMGLDRRLETLIPVIEVISDTVYRATHPNGLVVDIDFKQKKVLKIRHPSGYTNQPIFNSKKTTKRKHIYAEEYTNGVNITLMGTDVLSCRLNNGISVYFDNQSIKTEDGIKLYFNNPEKIYMVSQSGEKVITDANFEIIRYISRGKFITVNRNERITFQNKHQIYIGKNNRLQEESWVNSKNRKMTAQYQKNADYLSIKYDDNTYISIKDGKARLFHNGIELNYNNRKIFAESYNAQPPSGNILTNFGNEGR